MQSLISFLAKAIYPALSGLLFTFIICFLLWLVGLEDVEPEEPPVVRSRIPFIGHVIGLLSQHNNYFTFLSKRYTGPIFTVKIFSIRIYIVQSPDLAQAAFRESKGIDFDTFKVWACKAIGYGKHGTDILRFRPPKPERSYLTDLHDEMYPALAQGPRLLETNARVLNYLSRSLNGIHADPKKHRLFRWLRDEYTLASAYALYGSQNPISEDPSLIQAVWDFEKDLGLLILDFLPKFTAPKGFVGRALLAPTFKKYYDDGLENNANGLIKGRLRAGRKWGLTNEEIGKADLAIIMAAGTNTVPNVFYMICNIYSQPELLESLRKEISKIVTRKPRDGVEIMTLDISVLQSDCPLLTACTHETLRLTKTGASVRTLLEDVMLDGKYLLKKGSFLQIPTGVLQADLKTWGPDAKEFNPYRFLTQDSLPKEKRKTQNQAFMPFGGGRNLCPGRHLAFTEIAAFAAMLVYGFELKMSNGDMCKVPKGEFQKLGVASISPAKDMDVLIKRRDEFEGVIWEFDVGDA